MDERELGKFIADIRKENHLTQAQLASKLNVSDKTISKWETGRGMPDLHMLEPLSKALNISMMELLKQEKSEDQIYSKETVDEMINELLEYNKRKKASFADYFILGMIIAIYVAVFLLVIIHIPSYQEIMYVIGSLLFIVSIWRIHNHETYIIPLTISLLLLSTLLYFAVSSFFWNY